MREEDIGYEDSGGHTPLMTVESEELEMKERKARKMGMTNRLVAMSKSEALDIVSEHLTTNKAQLFPTRRRPVRRKMSIASQEVCDQWVADKGINVYDGLTPEQKEKANRLVYTWKDVFESDLLKIRTTDLIEHAIDLKPGAVPERAKIPLYTEAEMKFANKLIPQMVAAGLILRCDSIWVSRTKFPPKPNRPANQEGNLRMVHNYIPLNRYTMKSQYPCPRIDQIIHNVLKRNKKCFFYTDATDSYWAIPLRKEDYPLTAFTTPWGQYCYKVMGQGLKGSAHTYSRFRDLVFGAIPEDRSIPGDVREAFPSLMGDRGDVAFDGLIDDSYGSAETFFRLLLFLHEEFFPRCVFGPVYLKPSKTFLFYPSLSFVGLEGNGDGLRASIRKREQVLNWPSPTCYEEVDAFCFLTPFLRRFIPGRADLVAIMQDCGVARKNRAKVPFKWTPEKQKAFETVKRAIAENAMAPADPTLQYHLAVDASKRGLGGALFQLHGIEPHTEATNSQEHREAERIIHFLSFRLEDAERRYTNPEREALAVVKGLAEVKWMITCSPYPVYVYTDHQALKTLLTGPANDSHGKIANWQQRLSEYDMILLHRKASTHFMGIADGMSRLPSVLMGKAFVEDAMGVDAVLDWSTANERVGTREGERDALEEMTGIGGMAGNREDHGTERSEVQVHAASVEVNEEGNGESNETLEYGAEVLRWEKWRKWLSSDFFRKVVLFKLGGIHALTRPEEDVGRNEARWIVKLAEKFVLADSGGKGEDSGRLFFRERDGSLAACVVEEEVCEVLRNAHDAHGHFAQGITSGRLIGHFYWPSRNADTARWVATCDSCQRVSPMRKSGDTRPILQLQPMDMWGMDFIGPITPACSITGAKYVLIIVDYFSRFLFARPLAEATMQTTMDVILNHVVPITGWPRSIYSDNGSHFTGKEIQDMFARFGVTHFSAAISHPSAVGLAERYVQMLTGRIRLRCLDSKTSAFWGLHVRDAVLDINTRCIRIYGYTPAEILLGYNPSKTRKPLAGGDPQSWFKEGQTPEEALVTIESDVLSFIDKRDENGTTALERLAQQHQRKEQSIREPGGTYKRPAVGDLVLLRDLARDKHLGRKLDPRWTEPRIVDRLSKNGMSAYIRALHEGPERTKRYHIDDLKVYASRSTAGNELTTSHTAITYTRDAFGNKPGVFTSGQRAFDFTDIGQDGDHDKSMRKQG